MSTKQNALLWLRRLLMAGAGVLCALVLTQLLQEARADVVVVGTTAASRAATEEQELLQDEMDAAQLEALQRYIGEKYRVPLQAVSTVVDSAWEVGRNRQLDPLLLLAVMAIESSFNPKAQSSKGAQGLMQVMTRIHRKRFEPYGGVKAALKPEVNIEVGAQILQECIDSRGSVPGGLTCYVGASGQNSRYGKRVLAEFERLQSVVAAESVAPEATLVAQAPTGDNAAVVEPTAVAALNVETEAEASEPVDGDVIQAPPISRFALSDAPRLARTLLADFWGEHDL